VGFVKKCLLDKGVYLKTQYEDCQEKFTSRYAALLERAKKLGVLGVDFVDLSGGSYLDCLESTLDIIEENEEILYLNAGERK